MLQAYQRRMITETIMQYAVPNNGKMPSKNIQIKQQQ